MAGVGSPCLPTGPVAGAAGRLPARMVSGPARIQGASRTALTTAKPEQPPMRQAGQLSSGLTGASPGAGLRSSMPCIVQMARCMPSGMEAAASGCRECSTSINVPTSAKSSRSRRNDANRVRRGASLISLWIAEISPARQIVRRQGLRQNCRQKAFQYTPRGCGSGRCASACSGVSSACKSRERSATLPRRYRPNR